MIQRIYVEYYITLHCNLTCDNCATGSPFFDKWNSDFESFKRDVDNLSQYMHVGVFRFVGGEPTLNPRIVDYLKYIKSGSFADKTSVATNGTTLLGMSEEFWKYCDIINLSIYKNTNINYDKILKFLDDNGHRYNIATELPTIRTGMEKNKEYVTALNPDRSKEFRVLDQFTEFPPEVAQKVYETCPAHYWAHTFMNGKYYRCAQAIYRGQYYSKLGVYPNYNFLETDGINIDENFIENYNAQENSKEITMNVCRYCRGLGLEDSIPHINSPHRQMTKNEIELKKNGRYNGTT